MTTRTLRCAIEQVADWHSHLFVEPHVVAFVAVADQYFPSPALFDVECVNIKSRWLGDASKCRLEVSWHPDTAAKAQRMRATTQSAPLVEWAAIAIALVLVRRVAPLGRLDVTEYGSRADYRSRKAKAVLEVSGTEVVAELGRRHREKAKQARDNPFGWDAFVAVSAFSERGHHIRLSMHCDKEYQHAENEK